MTQPNDDRALIMRAWRGDDGAVDELGRRHGAALHALIVAQGGEGGADATRAAVLERARAQIRTCEDPAEAPLWLAGLVRRFAPARPAVGGGGPLARIRGLPPGPRGALMLRLLAGLPAWEVARYVGGTTEEVRADLARGAELVLGRPASAGGLEFLEDPERPPAAEIEDLVRALAHHAHVPSRPPRAFPWRPVFAGVGVLILAAAVLFFVMKPPAEPEGWLVVWTYGAQGSARLEPGAWFETGEERRARIAVPEVGHVDLEPNSKVTVARSPEGRRRVELARGALAAATEAPPRTFEIVVPSATVVDLGCAFFLEVDEEGHGLVRVTEGRVEVLGEDGSRCLVPAGAAARLPGDGSAGIPYFEDAPAELCAVDATAERALVAAMSAVDPRDSLTLFHLLGQVDEESRSLIAVRLDELVPRPEGVEEDAVVALDPAALAAWEKRLREEW